MPHKGFFTQGAMVLTERPLGTDAVERALSSFDVVNPGSVILSGVMMLEYLGWQEAADLILKGLEKAIGARTVTYDFERLMDGAKKVKTSEFAGEMIKHMG